MKIGSTFDPHVFASKDNAATPNAVLANLKVLYRQLSKIQQCLGADVKVNSAYRSPEHNARVGGSSRSQHLLGKAADIVVEGYTPDQVADALEELMERGDIKQGGLGRYKTFTHYDIRGTKARWDSR